MNAPAKLPQGVRIYPEMIQGSSEWIAARCGLLTASEMKHIITPTLKPANNEKEKTHLFELLAQRITGHVEPHYMSDDMLRGYEDEIEAAIVYGKHFEPVTNVGFITNNRFGFTLGFSPDGLVGEHGLIESKSRRQKFQVQTIATGEIPDEYTIQLQAGLLVSERQWVDFISYSGGLPMFTKRVYPDPVIQDAILDAATAFEGRLSERLTQYRMALASEGSRLIPTKRKVYEDILT